MKSDAPGVGPKCVDATSASLHISPSNLLHSVGGLASTPNE
ncbi:MAG: hypothetical protein ACOY90_00420 [Candidatus Zhuqueibacterota bacterium]